MTHCNRFEIGNRYDRRHWLGRVAMGLGGIAATDMMTRDGSVMAASANHGDGVPTGGILSPTHHRPTAKRVIYLFQSGGPSQLETWDYKPLLSERQGEPLPVKR